jgi:CheY-like chemotaxis protein
VVAVGDGPVAPPISSAKDHAENHIAGSVLLVDDEDAVRVSASEMLAEMGFAVFEADSAEKALRLLNDGLKVDLLITDHLMPGRTGVDLAYKPTFRSRLLPSR